MAGTTLKRKARKNRLRAKQRNQNIKLITFKPVAKNVDKEELIASFPKEVKKAPVKKAEVAEKIETVAKEAKAEVAEKVVKKEQPKPKATKTEKAKTEEKNMS